MPTPRRKPLQAGKSNELRLSPDGALAVAVGRNVVLWDVATRKRLASAHPFSHPSSVAFSPDATRLAVKNTSGEIVVLSVPDLATVCIADCRGAIEGSSVFYSPCGRFLIDATWGGVLAVRDASTGAVVSMAQYDCSMLPGMEADGEGGLFSFVLHHRDHEDAAASKCDTVALRRWPFDDHPARAFQPAKAWEHVERAVLSRDGTRLAVLIWQPEHKTILELHEVREDAAGAVRSLMLDYGGTGPNLAWSPDGRTIACVELQAVTLIDVATLQRRASHPLPFVSHLEFSRDGRLLAMGSWTKGVVMALEDVGGVA